MSNIKINIRDRKPLPYRLLVSALFSLKKTKNKRKIKMKFINRTGANFSNY